MKFQIYGQNKCNYLRTWFLFGMRRTESKFISLQNRWNNVRKTKKKKTNIWYLFIRICPAINTSVLKCPVIYRNNTICPHTMGTLVISSGKWPSPLQNSAVVYNIINEISLHEINLTRILKLRHIFNNIIYYGILHNIRSLSSFNPRPLNHTDFLK